MDNKKTLDCHKDFCESELLKYTSDSDNLLIFLKTWNEKILKFEFKECVMFQIFNTWNIEDVYETESSELFKKAIERVYEKVPSDHGFKLYQFMDYDEPIIEIACKNLSMLEVDMIS